MAIDLVKHNSDVKSEYNKNYYQMVKNLKQKKIVKMARFKKQVKMPAKANTRRFKKNVMMTAKDNTRTCNRLSGLRKNLQTNSKARTGIPSVVIGTSTTSSKAPLVNCVNCTYLKVTEEAECEMCCCKTKISKK